MSFNERILCIMLFGNEKNIGKSFLRGWMFHWYWDFSSLLIFRIKFPLLLFFSPSSPSLNSTKQWEKLSKNFLSFCTSSYALCFKVCDKSISSVFSLRENDEERNFSSRIQKGFPFPALQFSLLHFTHMFQRCLKFPKVLTRKKIVTQIHAFLRHWVLQTQNEIWEKRRERE